ncbi:DDB1 and CUL4 associated factor 12-like protein [Brevipalpus obovatus]|uniref:DDB1 and CUL4 associated factor 12-like protein n=1 Tax=Brevipalpus obovatus TaxID=246614 RepID=UPI003D9F3955
MAQVKRIPIFGQAANFAEAYLARELGIPLSSVKVTFRPADEQENQACLSQNSCTRMDTSSPPSSLSQSTSSSLEDITTGTEADVVGNRRQSEASITIMQPNSPSSSQSSSPSQSHVPSSPPNNRSSPAEIKNFINLLMNDPSTLERIISGRESTNSFPGHSQCLVDYINTRSSGNSQLQRASLTKKFVLDHLLSNNILREREYKLGEMNKIFCSKWLNERQVIFGTKCNKLIVLDLTNGKTFLIPNLKSSGYSEPAKENCGIHCIQINPSRTLLVAGGEYPNDIAVYRLPTLEPVCVGERGHTDWIFDACWLDDQFFVTGSRDTKLALWRIGDELASWQSPIPGRYNYINPLWIHHFTDAEKIRALLYNERRSEIVALSLNAQLHQFDINSLSQKNKLKLLPQNDNVCLAQESDRNVYAVGSRTHVNLVDQRTFESCRKINISHQGIRSLSFFSDVLTIGTGSGVVLFYDIRNGGLINVKSTLENATLNVSKGWLDPVGQEMMLDMDYSPAIYTLQYDSSGTRLFTAGGPLTATQIGNFASLWR